MRSYIREKRIECGPNYLEVDIIPRTSAQDKGAKGKRGRKEKISPPKQKNLNDKNSHRYFRQLVSTNFWKKDLIAHLTYAPKFMPSSEKSALKIVKNFIARIKYLRKKISLSELKYILVTEVGKRGRIHHHLILNGGLDRDTIESLWRMPRKKGQEEGEKIGWANVDRLQPDEEGLIALCTYLHKNPQGKKRWSSSQNLDKPVSTKNDHKYSKKEVAKIAKNPDDRAYWEKRYSSYKFISCQAEYNEVTGWSLYVRMRRDC